MWHYLKDYVRKYNNEPKFSENVISLIRQSENHINKYWPGCVRQVLKEEEKYRHQTVSVNPLIINVTDTDFEESEEDEDAV